MTPRYYMGIDPGLDGAIALYAPKPPRSSTMDDRIMAAFLGEKDDLKTFDLPTLTVTKNKKHYRVLDMDALRMWLDLHAPDVISALIEKPHAMPKQGVASAFSFGYTCGVVEMAVASAQIPRRTIDPAVWKNRMGLSANKDETRRKASEVFPPFAGLWSKKGQDGRAEAALLALLMSKLVTV